MATRKQIDANRRNSLKSTGPVTDDGKKASRCNALKHGLAGSGLILPLDESTAVRERMAEWNSSLKPFDPYETWLLEVVAVESIRVDRCRIQERALREQQKLRAADSCDAHRRQSAEELAARISKNASVVAKLGASVAGASILLDRWRALGRVLELGDWSADQEALAHDLLGVPPALRDGAASPLFAGTSGDHRTHRRSIVRGEIAKWERLVKDVLPDREADERVLVEEGLPDLDDPAMLRLHRYETRCFRRLMWATQQMQSQHRNVSGSPERPRETFFPKPQNEVPVPLEPVVERPKKMTEASILPRTGLQAALGDRLYNRLAEQAFKADTAKAASDRKGRKELPSLAKVRPSQRAAKTASPSRLG